MFALVTEYTPEQDDSLWVILQILHWWSVLDMLNVTWFHHVMNMPLTLLLKYKRYMEISIDIDFWDDGEKMCCFQLISVVTKTLSWYHRSCSAIAVRGQLQNINNSFITFPILIALLLMLSRVSVCVTVMSHCQVKGISAIYYVCYTENMYIDITSLTEFSKLTTVTPFKDIYKVW